MQRWEGLFIEAITYRWFGMSIGEKILMLESIDHRRFNLLEEKRSNIKIKKITFEKIILKNMNL